MSTHAHQHIGSASQSYALAVLEYVERLGMSPIDVFGPDMVDLIRQPGSGSRLSIRQWQSMLQRACLYLNDPAFPIRLAATIKPRHLGMLGFLLMSCDTLGAAALTLQRYEQLLDSVNAADFHIEGDRCTLTWRPLIDHPPPEFIMLSMSLWVHQARWLTERPDLVCDIDFSFATPESGTVLTTYQDTFGGRVRFGQSLNQMTIPITYLSLPVAQRDAHVHESLRQQAEADMQKLLGLAHGFVEHLEAVVAEQLKHGQATLQQVAAAMDMAPRTLQSRLEGHGLGYRELLDRVRHRQAERHMRNPALSLAEVSALLGFSDQSAFQHAFKRWTGEPPGEYRRRLA
jgi:AraC-like DNA-binding protein